MDAFKIIKKHGVPAGVPVITAYVDPDAPGEAQPLTLYQHIITYGDNMVIINNNSSTLFTLNTFAKWLYDNNYKSATNAKSYYVIPHYDSITTANNTFTIIKHLGFFSDNGSRIYIATVKSTITFSDNTFSKVDSVENIAATITNNFNDKMIKIGG